MKYAVITGASKGLGAGIVQRFIDEKIGVISVSRTENLELKKIASQNNVPYTFFPCDLSNEAEVSKVFEKVMSELAEISLEIVYVVNNAGVIEPIDVVGNLDSNAVTRSIQVNLTAPIFISNLFLKGLNDTKVGLVNVTSGAAERPIHGWSVYCSTKAALNMFTKTTALELDHSNSSSFAIAYSPGIMDTEMQGTIRSSSKESFADLEKFKEYKEAGMLRSARTVADALVDLLLQGKIENGRVYNANELIS